jgi:hypothetical protein
MGRLKSQGTDPNMTSGIDQTGKRGREDWEADPLLPSKSPTKDLPSRIDGVESPVLSELRPRDL